MAGQAQEIHNWNPLEREEYILAFARLNDCRAGKESSTQAMSTGRKYRLTHSTFPHVI